MDWHGAVDYGMNCVIKKKTSIFPLQYLALLCSYLLTNPVITSSALYQARLHSCIRDQRSWAYFVSINRHILYIVNSLFEVQDRDLWEWNRMKEAWTLLVCNGAIYCTQKFHSPVMVESRNASFFSSNTGIITIRSLHPFTAYVIAVAAQTSVGTGPYTSNYSTMTPEDGKQWSTYSFYCEVTVWDFCIPRKTYCCFLVGKWSNNF